MSRRFVSMSMRSFVMNFRLFIGPCVMAIGAFATANASTEGSYTGANPSLPQIDSAWRALYLAAHPGSPVHDAILVYNKMTGGTITDASEDSLCILRFGLVGSNTAVKKTLMHYAQWQGEQGWGVSSTYRISPDGSKIAMFNNNGVEVCDTDATQLQVVNRNANLNTDQLNMSWDDSVGIRRLVYSIGLIIVRTVVNSDNSAGKTDTLWKHSSGHDPSAGSGASVYTSVNKVGHFLSFDMPVSVNVPVVADLSSQTAVSPTNGSDGCQERMLEDGGLGTVSYHEGNHLRAATLWRWPNSALGSVPCPNGQLGGSSSGSLCTDCGNNMFYWCDSDTNFMCQCGDNDIGGKDNPGGAASPGCYTKGFIREGKTSSSHIMYIGDYTTFPALWINPAAPGTRVTIDSSPFALSPRATVSLSRTELSLLNYGNKVIDNAILTNINGAVVVRGQRAAPDRQRFEISSIPAGMYILAWRSGSERSARFVTISK